ncbi:MAG: ABC transporter permease [Actinomycetota bacterium]|nr:ABC transporter permease [Actinomycetota bacterium]
MLVVLLVSSPLVFALAIAGDLDVTTGTVVAGAAPLVYATLGETITEKAGVVNLSLDGSLLLSAMAGFGAAYTSGNVIVGFLAAAAASALVALIIAYAGIELRLNQIAVGFVLFLLTTKLSALLGEPFVRQPGPAVPKLEIPLLADIPFLGRALFQHNLSVYGSIVLIAVTYWFFYRTRPGLEMQAVGERPETAFARGISVRWSRYFYTGLGGALVGIGGAAFSLDQKFGWSEGHVRNFGWIALAIVIFGGWHPIRVALGCYLFGALQVVALKLQPVFPGLSQVLPILPFPTMILTLVVINRPGFRALGDRFASLRNFLASEPPAALGTNFEQQ